MEFAKCIYSCVCVILFAGSAYAESGWTDYGVVAELNPTARHYYLARLNVTKNPSSCKDKRWFFQDYDAPGSEKMFLTLLEAIKSGLKARVYVTGKCNLEGYSEISSVSVIEVDGFSNNK